MINVQHVVKWFGPTLAVDDVSFAVERGEVLGFLGPNGAGKSTTMRLITGFLPLSAGKVEVGGHSIEDAPLAAKSLIGYLPENAPAYPEMTVAAFLDFIAAVRGLRGAARRAAVARVVELCFLKSVLHQPIDTLSKGYRHRTCFAQSIIHDPPVLVLDEPTDGLDPNQKHEVRELIKTMGRDKAIIVSTHILEEVDAICRRVIIIDRGKLVFNGSPGELRGRSERAGAVTVGLGGVTVSESRRVMSALAEVGRVEVLGESPQRTVLRVFPQRERGGERAAAPPLASAVVGLATAKGWTLDELHTDRGQLDEVFRAITIPDTAEEGGK